MTKNELEKENELLKKKIENLEEQIEKYRRMEVELSTEVDLLRLGIIK